MTPKQLSANLVRIANAIDASKNPDRVLVANRLKSLLAAVGGTRRKASDWEGANKLMPQIEKIVKGLVEAVKSQDDEASNLAGALSGFAGDLSGILEKK